LCVFFSLLFSLLLSRVFSRVFSLSNNITLSLLPHRRQRGGVLYALQRIPQRRVPHPLTHFLHSMRSSPFSRHFGLDSNPTVLTEKRKRTRFWALLKMCLSLGSSSTSIKLFVLFKNRNVFNRLAWRRSCFGARPREDPSHGPSGSCSCMQVSRTSNKSHFHNTKQYKPSPACRLVLVWYLQTTSEKLSSQNRKRNILLPGTA
jgi:hypothetical protein